MQLYKASTFWRRLKGLLGKKAWPANRVLLIRPCNSVHTFGMRFSICVIFLDYDYRVLKVAPCLKPWRFAICHNAYCVLELSSGVLSGGEAACFEQACCIVEKIFPGSRHEDKCGSATTP
ncbi:DUF192 domain-containing protein [Advenella sp. RU8]|uniref:DUF192 domain-containing protein n=1 Tax=Advenella sp. RU8 TaxID=3399575 RepID=UPI003AB05F8E